MEQFAQRFQAARKAVIAGDLRRLNPMQRQAAMSTEGPLLLLAGAGSGKTTVLIQRIYVLLAYGRGSDTEEIPAGVTEADLAFLEQFPEHPDEDALRRARRLCAVDPPRPWEILAITFTNKAAGELKERLSARLGPAAEDVWASTFHSACVRILRRDIDRLGFQKDFTIYDTDDSRRVIKEIVKELNLDEKTFPAKSVLSIISSAKDQYLDPAAFSAKYQADKDWRMARIAKVYAAYQQRLHKANALDFDDLIFHTVTLLKQEPEVREYYQTKFRYVLVDEYQDTNHMQYLLTAALAGKRRNLCVVGDDDQSIYRFRGANIENILRFEEQYADARVIRLEQNYRSTQNILDAANQVIQNNLGRKGKTLWTENGKGGAVRARTLPSESDEADFIAGEVLDRVRKGGHFKDTAVLYRMNAQSNALEYAMKRNGIPYRVVGGMKFFDRAEVKDMLAYLCVVNNPLDDLRLRRIVNNPGRGIGGVTLNKIADLAAEQELTLYEVMRNADLFPELKTVKGKLLKFADLVDDLRKKAKELALPEFYDALCEASGYTKALEEKKDAESQARLDNVRELKSNILGFVERGPEDPSLSGFLNEISLYTDLDSTELGSDCVTMMTIHAAKGLEFPAVYVVGMEEGIFPGANSAYREEDLEEERRLCYVAMTRAKETLVLTNARLRTLYGRTSSNPPSRFLEEIPSDQIQWEGKEEPAWSGRPYGAYGAYSPGRAVWNSGGSPVRTMPPHRTPEAPAATPSAAPSAPSAHSALSLSPGDTVEHTAFGQGTVLSVTPLSGDTLVQVEFPAGVKKLMLKYAGTYMKKL